MGTVTLAGSNEIHSAEASGVLVEFERLTAALPRSLLTNWAGTAAVPSTILGSQPSVVVSVVNVVIIVIVVVVVVEVVVVVVVVVRAGIMGTSS
jgi:hypothetical protein